MFDIFLNLKSSKAFINKKSKSKSFIPLKMRKISQTDRGDRFLRGFTLIELLVVIGIIAILVVTVILYLNVARKKSRDARRKLDLKNVGQAVEFYSDNNNNNYPDSLADLVPQYYQKAPTDPESGDPYTYTASGDGQYYEVNADLEVDTNSSADNDGGNEGFPVYEVGNNLTLLP